MNDPEAEQLIAAARMRWDALAALAAEIIKEIAR